MSGSPSGGASGQGGGPGAGGKAGQAGAPGAGGAGGSSGKSGQGASSGSGGSGGASGGGSAGASGTGAAGSDRKQATNTWCEMGEVLVPPALDTGASIANLLDPPTTRLCISTPTGNALITASKQLTSNFTPGRAQYVALVTDGADWDQSCPSPAPLAEVQKLAASGIRTFVVGFYAQASAPGGVGIAFLNDMACAGQTAEGFPAPCKQQATGYAAADPSSPPLYLEAADAQQLETVLVDSLGKVRCQL